MVFLNQAHTGFLEITFIAGMYVCMYVCVYACMYVAKQKHPRCKISKAKSEAPVSYLNHTLS